jgi:adiponectin receptor
LLNIQLRRNSPNSRTRICRDEIATNFSYLHLPNVFNSSKMSLQPLRIPSILTLRRPGLIFTRASQSQEHEKGSLAISPPHDVPHLQRFEELPTWYQDNPFIRSGYRPVSYSSSTCLYSWTFLHNETLNIFTHLIPAILSLVAQISIQVMISSHFPRASREDRLIFSLYILSATVTLVLSTGYHTFMNHSFQVSSLWLRIDYVGILTLILGSFFSGIYVGYYSEPILLWTYWTMIITLSVITSILVLHPRLQGLPYRGIRTTAFVATALSGFAPIANGLWLYGWEEMWVRSGMSFWLLEGICYGIGAFFFATRIPESILPGKFDILFGSHQIFHVMVVVASIVHFMGVWDTYRWNYYQFIHR